MMVFVKRFCTFWTGMESISLYVFVSDKCFEHCMM